MKKAIIALAAAGVLLLSGCASEGSDDSRAGDESSNLYERTITLEDGRTVTCVVYTQYQKGGLSCDWEGAK